VDLQGLHVTCEHVSLFQRKSRIPLDSEKLSGPESSFESSYQSFYPWSFLFEHSYNPPLLRREDLPTNSSRYFAFRPESTVISTLISFLSCMYSKVLWDNSIASNLPTVTYSEVMESELGVYEWVKRIVRLLFFFFCPTSSLLDSPNSSLHSSTGYLWILFHFRNPSHSRSDRRIDSSNRLYSRDSLWWILGFH